MAVPKTAPPKVWVTDPVELKTTVPPAVYEPPVLLNFPPIVSVPVGGVKVPPEIARSPVVVMAPPPPVKPPDEFDWLKLAAVMLAEVLELAVKVCVPDSCMAPETEIAPVCAPPANDPPDRDVEEGLSRPLPGVYVPLVMVNAPPMVTVPAPAMKLPPFKVKVPAVMVAEELELAVKVCVPDTCKVARDGDIPRGRAACEGACRERVEAALSRPLPGVYVPPVMVNAVVTVMVAPPPVKPDVFARLRLLALMVAAALELAVNACVPDSWMAPETEIFPVVAPPANEPAESDMEAALSWPLPGVYVPPVMVNAVVTVMVPPPPVKPPDVFDETETIGGDGGGSAGAGREGVRSGQLHGARDGDIPRGRSACERASRE